MKNEDNFINEVWNKYDLYLKNNPKDNFFKKHQYKNTDYTRKVRSILSLFFVIFSSIGIVYAGNFVYNEIIQNSSIKNNSGMHNYIEDYQDMVLADGRHYKKITTYEDYIATNEKLGNLVEMTKEDFENNFVLVIVLERFEDSCTYISNIGSDDEILYIELKKYSANEIFDNNNVLSVKIANSQNRENVKIELIQEEKPMSNDYTNLLELPSDYSIDQAITDNCFVISGTNIISQNKNQLDEFVEKTKNGENDFIRIIINFENNQGMVIKDIEYRNGKYLICVDETRFESLGDPIYNTSAFKISYKQGEIFEIKNIKSSESGEYYAKMYQILEENDVIPICMTLK